MPGIHRKPEHDLTVTGFAKDENSPEESDLIYDGTNLYLKVCSPLDSPIFTEHEQCSL